MIKSLAPGKRGWNFNCVIFKCILVMDILNIWLPAWWALRLPWWPPAECSNVSMLSAFLVFIRCFLFLYHTCILSEIKLTTTTIICCEIAHVTSLMITQHWISAGAPHRHLKPCCPNCFLHIASPVANKLISKSFSNPKHYRWYVI